VHPQLEDHFETPYTLSVNKLKRVQRAFAEYLGLRKLRARQAPTPCHALFCRQYVSTRLSSHDVHPFMQRRFGPRLHLMSGSVHAASGAKRIHPDEWERVHADLIFIVAHLRCHDYSPKHLVKLRLPWLLDMIFHLVKPQPLKPGEKPGFRRWPTH
jgi:hypothetical protein